MFKNEGSSKIMGLTFRYVLSVEPVLLEKKRVKPFTTYPP